MAVLSYLLGLTGGIGSGKSTVAGIMASLGAVVVDADAVSRSTTAAGGSAMSLIRTDFGADFVDACGAMDRAKMRELIFTDAAAKTKLEAIVHPLIQQGMQDQIQRAMREGRSLIVLDLPLLAERTGFMGWKPRLDAVWVVDCPEPIQVERVQQRSGMSETQIRAVMDNQASRRDRLAIADVVITNANLNLEALRGVIITALSRLPSSPDLLL